MEVSGDSRRVSTAISRGLTSFVPVSFRPVLLEQPDQFLCVHMTNVDNVPLYPFEIINERLEDNAIVHVELLGPKLGPNDPDFIREKTLWELYAYTPPHDYVPVVFIFEAAPYAPLRNPPGVFGNFNGWGQPIPMKRWKNDVYRHQIGAALRVVSVFSMLIHSLPCARQHMQSSLRTRRSCSSLWSTSGFTCSGEYSYSAWLSWKPMQLAWLQQQLSDSDGQRRAAAELHASAPAAHKLCRAPRGVPCRACGWLVANCWQ